MTFLPGWDSSEFVRTAHRDLEFASIIGFVVCAGCELIKHLNPSQEKLFERLVIGTFLFAAFMELIAFPYGERNDELARQQSNKQDFAISELSSQAQEALGKIKKAIDDSDSAVSKAAAALSKSQSAEAASGSALTLARSARQEADSFEKDIKDAKRDASEAKALLADAQQLAATAKREAESVTREVSKVKVQIADRHLTPQQQSDISTRLCSTFGARNLAIALYNADGEMQDLAKDIKGAFPVICIGNGLGWAVSLVPWGTNEGFSGIRLFLKEGFRSTDRDFAIEIAKELRRAGLSVEDPTPWPRFSNLMGGGGSTSVFTKDAPGVLPGNFVEIAIGKKP
jgi:hypothetical protein